MGLGRIYMVSTPRLASPKALRPNWSSLSMDAFYTISEPVQQGNPPNNVIQRGGENIN